MIAERQDFFGMNLETRHDRRVFVLGYCGLFLLLILLGVFWNHYVFLGGMLQSVALASGLGGLGSGGPVKSFSGRQRAVGDLSATTASFPVQTLNLESQLPTGKEMVTLDERETTERDRAHFAAFRLLRFTAAPLCLLLTLALYEVPRLTVTYAPAVLWTVIMLVLTLPQLVILWTEPDALA